MRGNRGAQVGVDVARLLWAAALLGWPARLCRVVGAAPTRRAVWVTRLLGMRNLLQGGVLLSSSARQSSPVPIAPRTLRRTGAGVDVLHAASCVVLADRQSVRRPWLVDGMVALGFGAATWWTAADTTAAPDG